MLKVMGANAIIVSVILVVDGGLLGHTRGQVLVVLAGLALACIVNVVLVRVALSPIDELQRISQRVSRGEFTIRATPSLVADPQLAFLTDTVNSLLDSLAAERRRIQKLGTQVVSAQDTERAKLARELHDSIAQTLAAVRFQLTAAGMQAADDEMRNRLATAKGMIGKALDEVTAISHSLHPRVAEDLGLVPALESLAEETGERGMLKVRVKTSIGQRQVPANIAATLFRVAQEALRNAEGRAAAGSAEIALYSSQGSICLEVRNDSQAVDTGRQNADNSDMELSSIRDRVVLTGGVMRIESTSDGGMVVTAELDDAAEAT
jgi:signal transduction histidine kinase